MYDADDRRDTAWSDDGVSARQLRELVQHRYVVEILGELADGPTTLALASRRIGGGRRGLATALRIVAAGGLIGTDHSGSWDTPAPRHTRYHLTDRGCEVVELLSSLSVWTALIEGPDPDPAQERRR